MKISAKVEYACTELLELAGQFDTGQPARIRTIAAEHSIPQRFLVQILLQLKGAGLVASSDPEAEAREIALKLRVALAALGAGDPSAG